MSYKCVFVSAVVQLYSWHFGILRLPPVSLSVWLFTEMSGYPGAGYPGAGAPPGAPGGGYPGAGAPGGGYPGAPGGGYPG